MSVSEDRRTLPWIILRQEGGVDPGPNLRQSVPRTCPDWGAPDDDGSTVEGVTASAIPARSKITVWQISVF